MKDMLDKVTKLANLEVENREVMAERLNAVLSYVGQLQNIEIDAPEVEDPHQLEPEKVKVSEEFHVDRPILCDNFPKRDELGVWVPKFVNKE